MFRLIPGMLEMLPLLSFRRPLRTGPGRRSIFTRQISPIDETTREWMRRDLDYDSRACTRRRRQAERLAAKRGGAGE